MALPKTDLFDEELKKLIHHVATVCMSEEFNTLRRELENIYYQNSLDNVAALAFRDALLALLAEESEVMDLHLTAN